MLFDIGHLRVGYQLKNIKYLASQPGPFPSNLMVAFKADYHAWVKVNYNKMRLVMLNF